MSIWLEIILAVSALFVSCLTIVATYIGIKSLKLTELNLAKTEEVKIQTDPDTVAAKKFIRTVKQQLEWIEEKDDVNEVSAYCNLRNILTSPLFEQLTESKYERESVEIKESIKNFNKLTEKTERGIELNANVDNQIIKQQIDLIYESINKLQKSLK